MNKRLWEEANFLDKADLLKDFRTQFCIPKQEASKELDEIYFCGNSLGLQPRKTKELLIEEMDKWAKHGVKGHFLGTRPWMPFHKNLTHGLSQLVGGKPSEVVAMNSLTTNLHLLMVSFYQPTKQRFKILLEEHSFPSDHFAIESQIKFHGFDPKEAMVFVKPEPGEETISNESITSAIELHQESLALVLLPGVQYYTGQFFKLDSIARAAKKVGATVGFDLAHAIGNVPLNLHDDQVDFAVWCHYKYLNSGPGAVGGAFVHEKHHHRTDLPRFSGWWGHKEESRFRMENKFEPIPTAEAWQLSNPPIASMICIKASLDTFEAAGGILELRKKSILLTNFLEKAIKENFSNRVSILTPSNHQERGAQLSISILKAKKEPKQVYDEIEKKGVVCDWRYPNVIRVAPTPLYNQFREIARFIEILDEAMR
jgi:kynureninase